MKKRLLFQPKLSSQDIAQLFRQLAALIAAGIPLVQTCEIIAANNEHKPLHTLLSHFKREMEAGNSFSHSLYKYPRYFDELTCHLIYTGEQTGTLDVMLHRVCEYKDKSILLRRKIKQALLYPVIVCLTAIVITLIMLIVVVPRFEELFQSAHAQLPTLTRAVVNVSRFLRDDYWIFIFPLLIGCCIPLAIKKTNFKLPLISRTFKKILLARFARGLATLNGAGIPIIDSLKMTTKLSQHLLYIRSITHLIIYINSGRQLHAAMRSNPFFPAWLVQMIKVGEESGSLERMLDNAAEMYETDIDFLINNLSHVIEPLIIMILGVLIGGLVIAMYLPIFKLGTVI